MLGSGQGEFEELDHGGQGPGSCLILSKIRRSVVLNNLWSNGRQWEYLWSREWKGVVSKCTDLLGWSKMGAFKYEKVPDSVLKKSWSLRGTTKKKACFSCWSLSLTLSGLLSFLSCYLLSQSEGSPHQTAKLCPGAALGCRELPSPCQAWATAVGEKRN